MTPTKNAFKADLTVTMTPTMPGTDSSGVTIYYTLDGTTPNTGSTLYSAPFVIDDTFNIKAIGYANGDASSVFEKKYTKVDLAHLYARKTYGAGANIRLGETRRFEAQVWYMGEDCEPDETVYWLNESLEQEFGGDDFRMPEFDDDIEWFTTGGTIVKTETTEHGGSAVWTDDGFTTGYTITVKIGPNSFTGCNNNTGKFYEIKGCGCDEWTSMGCFKDAPQPTSDCWDIQESESGETCTDDQAQAPSGTYKCDSEGAVQNVPAGGSSPIPIPTIGLEIQIHVAKSSGTYSKVPYSFGIGARATGFHELRIIDSNTIIMQKVYAKTIGYYQFINNGSGQFYRSGGDEAYITKNGTNDNYTMLSPNGSYALFSKIDDIGTEYYRLTSYTDKSGNTITYDYETYKANDKMVITDASGNTYTVFAETEIDGVKLISKIVTKDASSLDEKTWTYNYTVDGFLVKERFEELYASNGYGDYLFDFNPKN